jgi:hypothetical protein
MTTTPPATGAVVVGPRGKHGDREGYASTQPLSRLLHDRHRGRAVEHGGPSAAGVVQRPIRLPIRSFTCGNAGHPLARAPLAGRLIRLQIQHRVVGKLESLPVDGVDRDFPRLLAEAAFDDDDPHEAIVLEPGHSAIGRFPTWSASFQRWIIGGRRRCRAVPGEVSTCGGLYGFGWPLPSAFGSRRGSAGASSGLMSSSSASVPSLTAGALGRPCAPAEFADGGDGRAL